MQMFLLWPKLKAPRYVDLQLPIGFCLNNGNRNHFKFGEPPNKISRCRWCLHCRTAQIFFCQRWGSWLSKILRGTPPTLPVTSNQFSEGFRTKRLFATARKGATFPKDLGKDWCDVWCSNQPNPRRCWFFENSVSVHPSKLNRHRASGR